MLVARGIDADRAVPTLERLVVSGLLSDFLASRRLINSFSGSSLA